VAVALVEHLAARRDWDVASLQKLPAASPILKELEAVIPGRLPWRRAEASVAPYLAIAGSWDAFWKGTASASRRPAATSRIGWSAPARCGSKSITRSTSTGRCSRSCWT
jgi:hypothetical protein